VLAVVCTLAAGTASCTGSAPRSPAASRRPAAVTVVPAPSALVLTGAADLIAARCARALFASAPVVVVATAHPLAELVLAVAAAERVHAPLLLSQAWSAVRGAHHADRGGPAASAGQSARRDSPVSASLRAAITALHSHIVLAVGLPARQLSAGLHGVRVVASRASLPATLAPHPLSGVALLVRRDTGVAGIAAAATARAAGVRVIALRGYDPRADPAAIAAMHAANPAHVLAVGAAFGPAARLAARVAVAAAGRQLPGGGQVLLPGHRIVALYGHPGTPSLGVLGQQGLPASIARARTTAGWYRRLSPVPVVPAFEIIATVAQASPGPDGSYSSVTPESALLPWVREATAAGMYVVLDLQPGRASLLGQAKIYQRLLELPNVGLALDPEWKLGPRQRPLRQIGSVTVGQVNAVISWLAALTARRHLPQKLLVLHQFRLSMIEGERWIDSRQDDLAVVIHMDGQGTSSAKQQTWLSVTGAAPPGVFFGWKNFYVKDHPVLRPWQTMAHHPQPVMISYQ